MEIPGDLEFDYPTNKTAASLPPSQIDRMHKAEVRLAIVATEIGNRALKFFTFDERDREREKVLKYAGEFLLLSSRIFKDNYGNKLFWLLDRSIDLEDEKETARKVLNSIPLTMYEVLTSLSDGASRSQVAAQFGLSEEYVWENMRKLYEILEVNQPGEALAAIVSLVETSGYGQLLMTPELKEEYPKEDPKDSLSAELVDLSSTELDILGCVCLGLTNSQIAQNRFVTVETVKFHLTNIFRKLGVKNRTSAAAVANKARLVEWALMFQNHESLPMPITCKANQEIIEASSKRWK